MGGRVQPREDVDNSLGSGDVVARSTLTVLRPGEVVERFASVAKRLDKIPTVIVLPSKMTDV